jgi:hypothetical protein
MASNAPLVSTTPIPTADAHHVNEYADSVAANETWSRRNGLTAPDGIAVAGATWDAFVLGPARSRVRRDLLSREIGLQLRHVFSLVSEFIALVQGGGASPALGAVLDDVIRNARRGFQLAARMRVDPPRVSAEKRTCLTELGQLRHAHCADQRPPPRELSHSKDALIVQFVRIGIERNNPPGIHCSPLTRLAREQAGTGGPDALT